MGSRWALTGRKYLFKSSPDRWISDRPELARAIARTSSPEVGSGRRNSSSRKTSTRFESRRLGVIGWPKASAWRLQGRCHRRPTGGFLQRIEEDGSEVTSKRAT